MLEAIYKQILLEFDVLYNHAVIHGATNDLVEYQKCANKLVTICETLGIPTERYAFDIQPQK